MSDVLIIGGMPVVPVGTPISEIRARLAGLPGFERYAGQVDAILALLDKCREWLPDDTGPELCLGAIAHTDSIYQAAASYSPSLLADEVRLASGCDVVTDIQAITAFAMACSLHALCELGKCLQGMVPDEIAALDLYRTHLNGIVECVPSAGAWLPPDECEACAELGELAGEASKQADHKAWGCWGEIERHRQSGEAQRDQAIRMKALELIRAGTRFHNLNSKLRAWQERETGKALSKPAMGAILQRLGLSISPAPVNQRKK